MAIHVRELVTTAYFEEYVLVQSTVDVAFGKVMYSSVVAAISAYRTSLLPPMNMVEKEIHRIQSDSRDRVDEWVKALAEKYKDVYKWEGETLEQIKDDVDHVVEITHSLMDLKNGKQLLDALESFEQDKIIGDIDEDEE